MDQLLALLEVAPPGGQTAGDDGDGDGALFATLAAGAVAASTPTDWSYKAEGGANVVFAYAGSDALLRGRVLRVRKVRRSHTGAREEQAPAASASSTGDDRLTQLLPHEPLAYAGRVMRPIVGGRHVIPGTRVRLGGDTLAGLEGVLAAAAAAGARPARRRGDALDAAATHAVLMVDHSVLLLPPAGAVTGSGDASGAGAVPSSSAAAPITRHGGVSLCVELKPKAGTLPPWRGPHGGGPTLCRFCAHQALKAVEEEEAAAAPTGGASTFDAAAAARRLSHYCPLRLYAADNDPASMAAAVGAMMAAPQNNFRLFDGAGALVYGAETIEAQQAHAAAGQAPGHATRELRRVLARLFHDGGLIAAPRVSVANDGGADSGSDHHLPALLAHVIAAVLRDDGVLTALRGVQDAYEGPGGAADAWADYRAVADRLLRAEGGGAVVVPVDDNSGAAYPSPAAVKAYASLAPRVEAALAAALHGGGGGDGANSADAATAAAAVRLGRFMVATTAKDASLMLALRITAAAPHVQGDQAAVADDSNNTKCSSGGDGGDDMSAPRSVRVELRTALPGGAPTSRAAVLDVAYSVAVVDLDPKPLARVPHYARLEAQLAAVDAQPGSSTGRAVLAAGGKVCALSSAAGSLSSAHTQ